MGKNCMFKWKLYKKIWIINYMFERYKTFSEIFLNRNCHNSLVPSLVYILINWSGIDLVVGMFVGNMMNFKYNSNLQVGVGVFCVHSVYCQH